MNSCLGVGDSGMMGVKVLCDLFIFMAGLAEVRILVGELNRCYW